MKSFCLPKRPIKIELDSQSDISWNILLVSEEDNQNRGYLWSCYLIGWKILLISKWTNQNVLLDYYKKNWLPQGRPIIISPLPPLNTNLTETSKKCNNCLSCNNSLIFLYIELKIYVCKKSLLYITCILYILQNRF